jgi:hypothetical protein
MLVVSFIESLLSRFVVGAKSGFKTHFSRFYAQQLQGDTIPQIGYETGSKHLSM